MSGRVILMGSGELAPGLVATHRAGMEAAETDRVVILDTPYGFQENADQLTDRIASFFETSLRAQVEVATLRREKADAVTQERFLATLRNARYVFSGPGSPSYALRVWGEVGIADLLPAVVAGGGTLAFASAASLTLGNTTLPVYEIYKVGSAPAWLPGLDVLASLGFPSTVVPHWNNTEGGNHDTSRCYVGERRFSQLESSLEVGVIGVDEHTAATIDFGRNVVSVSGLSRVTLRGATETVLNPGSSMPIDEALVALGGPMVASNPGSPGTHAALSLEEAVSARDPETVLAALLDAEAGSQDSDEARGEFRSMLVRIVDQASAGLVDPRDRISGFVDLLLDLRSSARSNGDYATDDVIRDGLVALGVEVRDTPTKTEWDLQSG